MQAWEKSRAVDKGYGAFLAYRRCWVRIPLNPLGDVILCRATPSHSKETINRGTTTPIPPTHALNGGKLKDPDTTRKGVPL